MSPGGLDDWHDSAYASLTDTERDIYAYIYQKDGKEAANKFLDSIKDYLETRTGMQVEEFFKGMASSDNLGDVIVANLFSIAGSPLKLAGTIDTVYKSVTGQSVNPYAPTHVATTISGATQAGTMEHINKIENPLLKYAASTAYQGTVATLESAWGSMFGAISPFLMGGEAADSAML